MSTCSDFFLFNFSFSFPHLSLVFRFVTINFGPCHWPLGIGRLAKAKAGWHSRTTVSVYAMYCAPVLCVISFHLPTNYTAVGTGGTASSRGPDSCDLPLPLMMLRVRHASEMK